MDSLLLSSPTFLQSPYGGRNHIEEKRVLEKSKSLLNWLTEKNFDKIKDAIVEAIRPSPTAFVIKSLVCSIFEMAMVENAYILFARLCVEFFLSLPPFRSDESHGEVTTFERLFLLKCRMELEKSSPKTDRPPLVYVEESNCWRFVKTVRLLAQVFKNKMVDESTKQSIIQVLMDPNLPPERNTDAVNLFLSSIGKIADFQFSDENFKQLVQVSRATELEKSYKEEVKLRKEGEEALAREKEELEMMKKLLESYKEEKDALNLQVQELEKKHQEELLLRQETENFLAIERVRIEKLNLQLRNLGNEVDNLRLKAEDLESKYNSELSLREQSEYALEEIMKDLEEKIQLLETCYIEQENLTSQVRTWQTKYEEESSLKKETEDARSRESEELEIVKGLLESYNQEADAMREERDNALKTVEELRTKQTEERQPLSSFTCPITQEIMKDPHFAADGFTYEAEAIRTWLSRGRDKSPMTNLKLSHTNLVPNRALRSAIEEYLGQS